MGNKIINLFIAAENLNIRNFWVARAVHRNEDENSFSFLIPIQLYVYNVNIFARECAGKS